MWGVLFIDRFVPYGVNTPAVTDAKLQYLDLFAYCRDVLTGQNTAAYTFSNTLGGTAAAIWAYYLASPWNLLVLLFEKEQMNLFLEVLILAKCSAAAAAFAWMIGRRFGGRIPAGITPVLSVGYGLMQYTLAQGSNVMWLDGVILLPFIVLGVHRAVCARRFHPAELALPAAASVIANWYTGGINYLFSAIWLFYELMRKPHDSDSLGRTCSSCPDGEKKVCEEKKKLGEKKVCEEKKTLGEKNVHREKPSSSAAAVRTAVCRYLLCMGIGLLIASFLFVPNVIALRAGKAAGWSPAGGASAGALSFGFRGNPLSVLRSYRIGERSDISRVSFFCGTPALFGTAAFFISGRIRKREKAAAAVLWLVVWMSCFWKPLFYVFSLFMTNTSYWYRYGYLGCFVLLYLAAYWAGSLPRGGRFHRMRSWSVIPKAGAVCLLLILVSQRIWPSGGSGSTRTAALMIAALMIVMALIYMPADITAEPAARYASCMRKGTGKKVLAILLILLCLWESFLETRAMLRIYHTDTAREYEVYSEEEQAQIRGLQDFDTDGFYRISQTSTRITNIDGLTGAYLDAMAYGYASISGYTSCPENIQLDLLDRLGYRKEYDSFNIVNTSFLPADSLMGVRYVLSPYEIPGLTEVPELGVHNRKAVYRNPYALPIAMVLDQEDAHKTETADKGAETSADLEGEKNPFSFTERLYTRLAGHQAGLWIPVPAEKHYERGTTEWTLTLPRRAGAQEESLQEPAPQSEDQQPKYCLYGNLPWEKQASYADPQWWDEAQEQGKLTVAEGWAFGYGGWLSPSVFYIPADEEAAGSENAQESGWKKHIVLQTAGEPQLLDQQFYALDLERMAVLTAQIRARSKAVRDLRITNGTISCVVDAEEGQSLLFSVPASDGWTAQLNGQKTQIRSFEKGLMEIPLVQGENHITMQYRVPGLMPGTGMSLAGLLILAVMSGTRTKRHKKHRFKDIESEAVG